MPVEGTIDKMLTVTNDVGEKWLALLLTDPATKMEDVSDGTMRALAELQKVQDTQVAVTTACQLGRIADALEQLASCVDPSDDMPLIKPHFLAG